MFLIVSNKTGQLTFKYTDGTFWKLRYYDIVKGNKKNVG